MYLFSIRPPADIGLARKRPRYRRKAVKVMIFSRPFEADGKKDGQKKEKEVKEEESKDKGDLADLFAL